MRPANDSEPPFVKEILSDNFGERVPDRIRRRRAHRLLELCCVHLRGFAGAIRKDGRKIALSELNSFVFAFKNAIASLRVSLGADVTQHYTDDFDGMLNFIFKSRTIRRKGRAGGTVLAETASFHPGLAEDTWRHFLDQHGKSVAHAALRQAERLQRLMLEVCPEATTSSGRRAAKSSHRRSKADEVIAKAIGLWAQNPGWSKAQLAKEVGVSRETLSRPPYKNRLREFRKKLDAIQAQNRSIKSHEHMGDDEWRSMHIE